MRFRACEHPENTAGMKRTIPNPKWQRLEAKDYYERMIL